MVQLEKEKDEKTGRLEAWCGRKVENGREPSRLVKGGLSVFSHRARCSALGRDARDLEGEVRKVDAVV